MKENVISFFQEVDKTVNVFSWNIELRTLLIMCLLILVMGCIFFLFFTFINRILMEQRLMRKNIKVRRAKREYTFVKKILKSFDSEELQLRFLHSGSIMGISTVETYFVYKVLFTVLGLILGLRLYQPDSPSSSIFLIVLLGGLGYFFVDFILYQGKKRRTKSIKEQLPMFLVSFDNYTKAGLLFEDILDIMPKLIHGDLQKELIRFNVSYSLSKDFEGCIKEFTKRLGIVEADELELKMRQCYYSGIYDDVLTNEKELIERKIVNDMRKESQLYNLYLAIAIAMMIVNIFVLVVIPIFNIASRDYKMFLGF